MTNNDEKVSDIAAVDSSPASVNRSLTTKLALFIAVISLIITLAAIAAAVFLGQRFNAAQKETDNKTQELQILLSQNQTALAQQQQLLAVMQHNLQQLSQVTSRNATDWVLAETNYLVQLAQFNLTFENNAVVATKLLLLADDNIKRLTDPRLLPVRQALANDITTLNAIPAVDLSGIITQLNALSQQVAQLPVIPNKNLALNTNDEQAADNDVSESLWKRVPAVIMRNLKEMVIIRHHQQPMQPLLMPEQQIYLIQNIQMQLAQARWAALHQDATIYQQSLQQAIDWIKQYFMQNTAATTSVITALTNLKAQDIKPTLPNLNHSLTAIQNAQTKSTKSTPSSSAIGTITQPNAESMSS